MSALLCAFDGAVHALVPEALGAVSRGRCCPASRPQSVEFYGLLREGCLLKPQSWGPLALFRPTHALVPGM